MKITTETVGDMLVIQTISHGKNNTIKFYEYRSGHVVKFIPHSLERLQGRKLERDLVDFENAAVKASNLFATIVGLEGFRGIGSRVAVRSSDENIIVILTLDSYTSETAFTISVTTVWNTDLGEFYFRRGMSIYDLEMKLGEGYTISKAARHTFTFQDKHVWEK